MAKKTATDKNEKAEKSASAGEKTGGEKTPVEQNARETEEELSEPGLLLPVFYVVPLCEVCLCRLFRNLLTLDCLPSCAGKVDKV